MKLNTYLTFNGDCEQALAFYEKVFGVKRAMLFRYKESPESQSCAPDLGEKVMHTRFSVGDSVIMMSDCPPERFNGHAGFSINVGVETVKEAESIFAALSDGAKEVCMPLGETFWAERFGMLFDKFGVPWMVNCEKKR